MFCEGSVHQHDLLHPMPTQPELPRVLADKGLEDVGCTLVLPPVDIDRNLATFVCSFLRIVGVAWREVSFESSGRCGTNF